MSRPNSISLSTFHSTVENMSGIAEAVHFPLSTRLYKAWKGGKETAGQKEEGTKAVSHHTPDADNNLERQGPMAGRGGCMLNGQTYTPALEAEAPPILTTLPEAVAVQLVSEMIRLNSEKVDTSRESNVLLQPSQRQPPDDGPPVGPTRHDLRRDALRPPLGP